MNLFISVVIKRLLPVALGAIGGLLATQAPALHTALCVVP